MKTDTDTDALDAQLPLAPYRVTFRVGGWDSPDQHRSATVRASIERAAIDAAAERVWGETTHWRPEGSDTYGSVWRHASRGGSTGGGWDAMTGRIGVSVAEVE